MAKYLVLNPIEKFVVEYENEKHSKRQLMPAETVDGRLVLNYDVLTEIDETGDWEEWKNILSKLEVVELTMKDFPGGNPEDYPVFNIK